MFFFSFFGARARRILLLLALAAPPVAAEEGSLILTVRNEDGTPAAGAVVRFASRLTGRVERRVAGPDGTVPTAGLSERRYLATAASGALGSASALVTAGEPAELILRFRAVREEVVVSASGAPRAASGALVATLSHEELDGRGEEMVFEALRGIPGLNIRQSGSPGHLVAASVRGIPAYGTAVMVDGAPMRDPAAPQADASSLLPSLGTFGISRVEVRRGGGSSLYGTNGMGGVIHIVTRGAGDGPRASAELGIGNRGKTRAGAQFGAGSDGPAVSGGVSRTGVTEGATGDDRFSALSGVGRVSFEAGGIRVGGRLLASSASFGLTESPSPVGALPTGVVDAVEAPLAAIESFENGTPQAELVLGNANFLQDAVDPDAEHRTRYLAAQVSLSGALGGESAWIVRLNDLTTAREIEDGPLGTSPRDPPAAQVTHYDGGVRGAVGRFAMTAGAHDLTLGAEGDWERMSIERPLSRIEARQSAFAGFLQDEIRFAEDRGRLRGALRVQGFATEGPDFDPVDGSPFAEAPDPEGGLGWSGDVSFGFAVSEGVRLRGSWARGFRAPSLYERFGTWYSSFGYSVYGDPRLEPEFTNIWDAGITVSSADGRVDGEAAWFQSDRPQIIGFGPLDTASDPFGRFSGYANTAAGTARGFESGLRLALPAGIRARGTFTWTDADPPDNAPDELPSAWLLPEYEGSLLLSGQLQRFTWSLDLHLASSLHAPLFDPSDFSSRVFRFEGRRRLDLVAGWEVVDGLRVRAQVRDALDNRAFESGGFRPLGRVFEAGIRYNFR